MSKSSKYLISTLVIGEEIEEIAKITVPRIEAYAKRVGADFIVLGKTTISDQLSPYFEKMQLFGYLDHYEQILFIDADILITPRAANLFEYCADDMVSAVSVNNVYKDVNTEHENLASLLGEVDWTLPYFNSGVVMFTQQHRALLNTTDGLIEKWIEGKARTNKRGLNDQSIFNYRVNQLKIPMNYIDKSFNFTKAWGLFEHRFSMNFIHYAGMKGQRLKRISLDSRILNKTSLFFLCKQLPLLTKIFDKIASKVLMS